MLNSEHSDKRKVEVVNKTGQRIRALRKRLGITQAELAKRMGFVRNYISLIENGREPSHRFIGALELIEQAPTPHLEHESVVHEGSSVYPHLESPGHAIGAEANFATVPGVTMRVIPLLTWAQAGTTQAWEEVYEHEGFVGFNVDDPKAVAVQIRGDSMEPRFPQGTIAIVYPGSQAKSGDLVIARLKDGTVLFKRLHVDGNQYTFISLNPIYPPRTVEKSKIEKVLPVGSTFQNQL
jgi:SOS-response transcriptional repressor LexA